MTDEKRITGTSVEIQKLVQRIDEANQAQLASEHANGVVADMFTMFCEAHDVPGASFVRIEDGHVYVRVPAKPEAPSAP